MPESTQIHDALGAFDKTTSHWGRITMIIGLFFSLAAPAYLVFFSGLDIELSGIFAAFAALAAVFGVIWIVEPLTYYPILGASSMYQAFMIGNISNKLLPAAMIAQSTIGVKPGTRKGELASVAAICGATRPSKDGCGRKSRGRNPARGSRLLNLNPAEPEGTHR